jgi:hypothetical protein
MTNFPEKAKKAHKNAQFYLGVEKIDKSVKKSMIMVKN